MGVFNMVNLYLCNANFEKIAVIDKFISLIWTTRFDSEGDFELYVSATTNNLNLFRKDLLLMRENDNKHFMIIQNITIRTDSENGNRMVISGKDLKQILHRRVVERQTYINGNLQAAIHLIIFESIINPLNNDRKISNFDVECISNVDSNIEVQIIGENIGEYIENIIQQYGYGYDVYFENSKIKFKLVKGTDRSKGQVENPLVVFSSDFGNLINSDYSLNNDDYKNVAIIGGDGNGVEQTVTETGSANGISRCEIWVAKTSASKNSGSVGTAEYLAGLQAAGTDELQNHIEIKGFEGEIDANVQFILERDYFIGDIIQLEDQYGHSQKVRISEIIYSVDSSGVTNVPTFMAVD